MFFFFNFFRRPTAQSRTVCKIPLFIQQTVHPTNSPFAAVGVNLICGHCVCLSDSSMCVFMVWYLIKHKATLPLNDHI